MKFLPFLTCQTPTSPSAPSQSGPVAGPQPTFSRPRIVQEPGKNDNGGCPALPRSVEVANTLMLGGAGLGNSLIASALNQGAAINACDGDDDNVLHKIVKDVAETNGSTKGWPSTRAKSVDLVLRTLDRHGERINLGAVNDAGDTPLHIAARSNQAPFFKALLDAVKLDGAAPAYGGPHELDLGALTKMDARGRTVFDLTTSKEVRSILGQLLAVHLLRTEA